MTRIITDDRGSRFETVALACLFRSDGNSRFECSTDLLTLVSESTGVMHRLSADPVKESESWNHSDMCRNCVH